MVAKDLNLLYSRDEVALNPSSPECCKTDSDIPDSSSIDWIMKAELELHLMHVLTADLDSAFVCFTVIDEELENTRQKLMSSLSNFTKTSHFAFIDDSIVELKKIIQKRSNCIQEKHSTNVELLSYFHLLSNAVIWILISYRFPTRKYGRISTTKNPRPFFPKLTEEDLREIELNDPNFCLFNSMSRYHGYDPYLFDHNPYHHNYNPCSCESTYCSFNPPFSRSNSHSFNSTTASLCSEPNSPSPKPSSLGPNFYFFKQDPCVRGPYSTTPYLLPSCHPNHSSCSSNSNSYYLGPNWFMKPRFSSPRGSMRSQVSSRLVNSIVTPDFFKYGRSTEEEIQKHFPILEEKSDYDKIKNWEIPYDGY